MIDTESNLFSPTEMQNPFDVDKDTDASGRVLELTPHGSAHGIYDKLIEGLE